MEDNYEDFENLDHLHDAQITTEDGTVVPVHRILLAMRSRYFHKLLCIDGWEDTNIPLPHISKSIMKIIINYLNTGNNNVIEDRYIPDILSASSSLGIEDLFQTSRTLISRNLTIRNCIPLLLTAMDTEHWDFLKSCVRFLIVHFERVLQDPKSRFYDIPIELFKKLLFSDSINISSEYKVLLAIEFWVARDPETRRIYVTDLLSFARFPKGNDNFPVYILNHTYVHENPHVNHIKDIINHRSLSFQLRTPKHIFLVTKTFIHFPNYSEGVKVFLTYDEDVDFWRNVGAHGQFYPNVVLHGCGSKVVLFDTMKNTSFMFDVISKVWTPLNPPTVLRREYNVVKLGRFIYALGGLIPGDEDFAVSTAVERYNFDTGVWELTADQYDISEGAAAAFDNKICVIGTHSGIFSETFMATSFNPLTETWTVFSPPNIHRRMFALVVYRHQLYILGGHNSVRFLLSVEVYDAESQVWKEFESLPFSYFLPKALVIKDTLYVYDQQDGDLAVSGFPPVRWDESNQQWQDVQEFSHFNVLHMTQICTINDDEVMIEMRSENRNPATEWKVSPFYKYV